MENLGIALIMRMNAFFEGESNEVRSEVHTLRQKFLLRNWRW